MILVAKLPEADQEALRKRTAELIAEESTLRQSREARKRSQEEIARKLHIQQAAVSKLERRTDMYLSTLRRFSEAMRGELEIIARSTQSGGADHPIRGTRSRAAPARIR